MHGECETSDRMHLLLYLSWALIDFDRMDCAHILEVKPVAADILVGCTSLLLSQLTSYCGQSFGFSPRIDNQPVAFL